MLKRKQMKLLKQKWSDAHEKGVNFTNGFLKTKQMNNFVKSVIRPVCERAGLGCPLERFTTNRSERTDVIQDFVKQKTGGKVDEYFLTNTERTYRQARTRN